MKSKSHSKFKYILFSGVQNPQTKYFRMVPNLAAGPRFTRSYQTDKAQVLALVSISISGLTSPILPHNSSH